MPTNTTYSLHGTTVNLSEAESDEEEELEEKQRRQKSARNGKENG